MAHRSRSRRRKPHPSAAAGVLDGLLAWHPRSDQSTADVWVLLNSGNPADTKLTLEFEYPNSAAAVDLSRDEALKLALQLIRVAGK